MNQVKGHLLKINGKYYTDITFIDSTGKKQRRKKTTNLNYTKANKKAATQILEECLNEYRNAYNLDASVDKLYFEDYFSKWMERMKKNVRPNTYVTYTQQMNKHILPYFKSKHILLKDLRHRDIQAYYQYELDNGRKPSSIKKYHANIHKALDEAVRDELIPYNPADKAVLPKKEKSKADYYSVDEVEALLKVVEGTKMEVPVKLTTMFGLRRSEVLGLRWDSINLQKKSITIDHTCVLVGAESVNINKTKNESSKRTLYMTDEMISFLKAVKKHQREEQMKQGADYSFTGYVCVDEHGEQLKPNYLSQSFNTILKKNNLRHIRFHDLRHTCASLLLNQGYQLADISKWLGHSTISTTADIYGHISDDRMKGVAEKIGSIIAI